MDSSEYTKEVNRLSQELNSEEPDEPSSSIKGGIMRYKIYIFISLGILICLYIIKPKVVLKIDISNEKAVIALDKGKLIKWWVLLSVLISLIHYTYNKLRKRSS